MEVKSLKFLFVIGALCTGMKAYAQEKFKTSSLITDASGKETQLPRYDSTMGSPYLFENWLPAKVTTDKGKTVTMMNVKYNVFEDKLIFLHSPGEPAPVFNDPIRSFTILTTNDMVFMNGLPEIDKQNSLSYYQVLSNKKLALLKRYVKNDIEAKPYNGFFVMQKIMDETAFYAFRDGIITPIKASKSTVLKLMADKDAEVRAYLKKHTVDYRREEDLTKLFDYYNTL